MAEKDTHRRFEASDLSPVDHEHLALIRARVWSFLADAVAEFAGDATRVLDIAPQDHAGVRPFLASSVELATLDIDPSALPTFVADLCAGPTAIPPDYFDLVVCTEVLEHTLDPFAATAELYRVVRPGGYVLASTPFNFRIHGPLPDCWRFTEHGLRALFKAFEIVRLDALDTPGRPLMPIHYTLVARRSLIDG